MSRGVFTCEAVYHGRRAVQGAQSSSTLNALVDNLLRPPPTQPIHHSYAKRRSERCQLVCDDEHIRVTPVRKDEGFESDTESSGSACDDSYCGTQDIKVINDHVLRLEQLIGEDGGGGVGGGGSPNGFLPPTDETSSSATSSGAESEDDSPRTAALPCPQTPVGQEVAGGRGGVVCVGDLFLMSDILYCHVSAAAPRVLVVVVKGAGSSQVHAHVFQCHTEDTARSLYAHYKEASNKYKLNRYRNSKRKAAEGDGRAPGKPPTGRGVLGGSGGGGSLRGEHDRNVNVIQIREAEGEETSSSSWNLVQHTDANGVTHIEIDSGPSSLAGPHDLGLGSLAGPQDLGLGSLSVNASVRSHSRNGSLNSIESLRGGSCPGSLVSTGREILSAGELDKRSRQRQPPLLLRREAAPHEEGRRSEDSLRRRKERKAREEEAGRSRRDWHEGGLVEVQRPTVEAMIPRLTQERPSRARDHSRARPAHNKGPAPPPPPRRHPENPSLLLVPTKSGAETARAFYPKESHIVRGNKIVRVEGGYHRGSSGWGCHDLNNNPYGYYGGGWAGPHEYHAPRSRDSPITPEMRRRSRSKSPARRPATHRYIDAVSAFSLSQKLKDISDAVFTARRSAGAGGGQATKGHQRTQSGDLEGTLRPVIKKGRRRDGSPQSRRVTFSAYATVQVMDA